jgi:AbiV family abortive infection protein
MIRLPIDECLSGMDKTIKNATRLTKEGSFLESKNSPTAIFLYAIAIEELSKAYTLGIAAIAILEKGKLDWDRFWKGFRNHKFKQTGLLKMILFAQELVANDFDDIKKKKPEILFMYNTRADVIKKIKQIHKDIERVEKGEMERLKWDHLYVDYLNGQWKSPKVGMKESFLSKYNIKVYLTDIKRMKSDIEGEIKRRNDINVPSV